MPSRGDGMPLEQDWHDAITPAVLGGCITMGGGSITSWVDTVVVQARNVGALS